MPGRIPQKFIDDLLDRVDIVEVVDRRVKLKKSGKNFSACCPFHDEKTPSFSVNPEKQFYYCFGCGAGGNALGFVMDYERMEFPEAVESLAQSVGLEVPREESRPGEKPRQDSNRPLYDILEQAARLYEHNLRRHEQASRAVTYLKGRGLSGETARDFRLGYAPPGWDNLMSRLGDSEPRQALLEKAGMLVRNDRDRVYDRFRDRVIFPILDARGRVIAFGGRVLGEDKPKYLNSPETPVFHKSRELYGLYQARKANRALTRVVVVEGYMDVIALAQHGIHYAVATLGTSVSDTHLERLFRHTPEVVFCFDGDEAGRKAAFRGLEAALPAMQDGRQVRFLFLPEGEDPDSLVRAKGPAHLEHLFETSAPLETYLFDSLAKDIDLTAMDGRARYAKRVAPYLNRLPAGVFQTLMYQSLAERTGIDVDSLKRFQPAKDHAAPDNAPPVQEGAPQIPEPPSDTAAMYGDVPPPEAYPDDIGAPDYLGYDNETSVATTSRDGQRLLGLLVLQPELARLIDPDAGLGPSTETTELALKVAAHIKDQHITSTAALLGFWYGTPEGQTLTDLAGQEPLEAAVDREALFSALLDRIARAGDLDPLKSRYEFLKQKHFSELNAEEKQELLTLNRRIRELSGRR